VRSRNFLTHSIVALAALAFSAGVIAQSQKERGQSPAPAPEQDTIKIDVDLVNVPVVASDRNDVYVYDLQKEDFTLLEDGVKQEIVFFGTVREPFHVVLMLDTSGSTREKLGRIQEAAKAFVAQLQAQDRIKIISFNDTVRDWGEFSNDRAELRRIIDFVDRGDGTKLYDAVKLALNSLVRVKGRKAIVLFTDGVDWHSDSTRYEDNLRQVEESGVLVYPIRYDTRLETEALIREQRERGETVDVGTIFGGGRGPTTPPTVPGGAGIPDVRIPPIIIGGGRYPGDRRYPDDRHPRDRRYPDDRYPDDRFPRDRYPDDRFPRDRYPDDRFPRDRYPDDRFPGGRNPDPRYPDSPNSRGRAGDTTSIMLDGLYRTADLYLAEMAEKSGGKLHRADTLRSLPDAFANIAAELRNQYSLGYYPTNQARDGQYHKLQVKISRRDVVVRARPGYRAAGSIPNLRDVKK
jgi:Mg-chelatase subunit ChlD